MKLGSHGTAEFVPETPSRDDMDCATPLPLDDDGTPSIFRIAQDVGALSSDEEGVVAPGGHGQPSNAGAQNSGSLHQAFLSDAYVGTPSPPKLGSQLVLSSESIPRWPQALRTGKSSDSLASLFGSSDSGCVFVGRSSVDSQGPSPSCPVAADSGCVFVGHSSVGAKGP